MQAKLYITLGLLGASSLFSQEVLWQKDLPSSTQDFLSDTAITIDEQYLLSGSSIHQNRGYDYHLVKLNPRGEKVWEKYYGGNQHDFLNKSISTREGGFALAGTSLSFKGADKTSSSFGSSDIWIIRIDEKGNELWQKTLGTKGREEAKGIVQTIDEGFWVAGNITDQRLGNNANLWLVQLDKDGQVTKDMVIGGKGIDEVQKMIPTLDGGVLIGAYSRSQTTDVSSKINDKTNANKHTNSSTQKTTKIQRQYIAKTSETYGEGDFWLIKLDQEGNVEWQKSFGGTKDDQIRDMVLSSNGYVVSGESRSGSSGNKTQSNREGTDLWLIALDTNGEEQWQKTYSFGNRDLLMSLNHITGKKSTQTKGFLLGGFTASELKTEEGENTFWMLYVDENGEEVWRKYVEGDSRLKNEKLTKARLLNDGGYLLSGTSSDKLGEEHWKVIKLKDEELEDLVVQHEMRIYPNPVADYCYVEIGFTFDQATIELYDMGGRMLHTEKTNNRVTKINTQKLVQGAYLIVVKTKEKNTNAKLIKN